MLGPFFTLTLCFSPAPPRVINTRAIIREVARYSLSPVLSLRNEHFQIALLLIAFDQPLYISDRRHSNPQLLSSVEDNAPALEGDPAIVDENSE